MRLSSGSMTVAIPLTRNCPYVGDQQQGLKGRRMRSVANPWRARPRCREIAVVCSSGSKRLKSAKASRCEPAESRRYLAV